MEQRVTRKSPYRQRSDGLSAAGCPASRRSARRGEELLGPRAEAHDRAVLNAKRGTGQLGSVPPDRASSPNRPALAIPWKLMVGNSIAAVDVGALKNKSRSDRATAGPLSHGRGLRGEGLPQPPQRQDDSHKPVSKIPGHLQAERSAWLRRG